MAASIMGHWKRIANCMVSKVDLLYSQLSGVHHSYTYMRGTQCHLAFCCLVANSKALHMQTMKSRNH